MWLGDGKVKGVRVRVGWEGHPQGSKYQIQIFKFSISIPQSQSRLHSNTHACISIPFDWVGSKPLNTSTRGRRRGGKGVVSERVLTLPPRLSCLIVW